MVVNKISFPGQTGLFYAHQTDGLCAKRHECCISCPPHAFCTSLLAGPGWMSGTVPLLAVSACMMVFLRSLFILVLRNPLRDMQSRACWRWCHWHTSPCLLTVAWVSIVLSAINGPELECLGSALEDLVFQSQPIMFHWDIQPWVCVRWAFQGIVMRYANVMLEMPDVFK